jgi:hypothetical protein
MKYLPYNEAAEKEMVKQLEEAPTYSHRGTSKWQAPTGFKWNLERIGIRDHSSLVRMRDGKKVLDLPKYTSFVEANDERIILTSMSQLRPVIYVIPTEEMVQVGFTKSIAQFEISPVLEADKLAALKLEKVIVQVYRVGSESFLWVWDSASSELFHYPVRWFNDCNPDPVIESIEKVVFDSSRRVILGSGARIPHFVMSGNGKELIGFLRTYGDRLEREAFDRKIRVWSERIDGKNSAYLG